MKTNLFNRPKALFLLFLPVLLILTYLFISCGKREDVIVIGSKNFTEQVILGEMLAQLIEEKTDIKVDRRFNLGGTLICFEALNAGKLDLYPEYTGTGLLLILKKETMPDKDLVYKMVKEEFKKRYNLVWFAPFGFNNTYTLTMRKEHAEKLKIKKISDLEEYKEKLKPGFDAEFMVRPDGYTGLIKHYGFKFKKHPLEFDPGLMYKAIAEKKVDVICGFATDGRIPAFDLVILKDDLQFFPPYYAAPLVRAETVKKYPELKNILNLLAGRIDDKKMARMNYLVDEKKERVKEVARKFLEEGLI